MFLFCNLKGEIMSILKSLLFGSEGTYKILEIPVVFKKSETYFDWAGEDIISRCAIQCINSRAFRFLTQGYAHVFVHEMSHALVGKLFKGNANVEIYSDTCQGTNTVRYPSAISPIKQSSMYAAGPMGDVAFCIGKIAVATFLKSYSMPLALTLGTGAVIWLSGELLYAYMSAKQRDSNDFGLIRKNGETHLAVAGAALVGECALGLFLLAS